MSDQDQVYGGSKVPMFGTAGNADAVAASRAKLVAEMIWTFDVGLGARLADLVRATRSLYALALVATKESFRKSINREPYLATHVLCNAVQEVVERQVRMKIILLSSGGEVVKVEEVMRYKVLCISFEVGTLFKSNLVYKVQSMRDWLLRRKNASVEGTSPNWLKQMCNVERLLKGGVPLSLRYHTLYLSLYHYNN